MTHFNSSVDDLGLDLSAALSERESRRLRTEIGQMIDVYRRLYPTEHLVLVLYEGHDPSWSAPSVVDGRPVLGPQHLTVEYLGTVEVPGSEPTAATKTIMISVPRAPLEHELADKAAPWKPNKYLRQLYRVSPLLYEEARYRVEMERRRSGQGRHTQKSLPRGRGLPGFPTPQEPNSDKRPAILVATHWLEVGGAEKLALDCIEWAREAGLRVFVVAGVPSLHRWEDRLPDDPDVTFLRIDRYLDHALWPEYVERLVQQENIQLIHIHHCTPMYQALPHVRTATPWVQVIDSTHIVEYKDGGYPRVSGVWSNYLDMHHVISGELCDYFRDSFRQISKVRLGRMLDGVEAVEQLPALNMTAGKPELYVSFVGRMRYQKRPIVVVEGLRALADWAKEHGVELRGVLVGSGPFEDAVGALLRKYGLATSFEMLPSNADIPSLFGRSDIMLLPSNNEGLALVCYEAIENGCIPISTDVGSQSELVPEGLMLPLSPRAGVQRLVEIVDRLWRDDAYLQAQQQALHDNFKQLTADPTAKDVLAPIYQSVAHPESED